LKKLKGFAGLDEIFPSTPPHPTSGAGTLTGKGPALGPHRHGGHGYIDRSTSFLTTGCQHGVQAMWGMR